MCSKTKVQKNFIAFQLLPVQFYVFAFMSMIGAQTSYHVAEIGSGHHPYALTPLDFLPTHSTYETGWHFLVNKEDRYCRDFVTSG